VLVQRNCQPPVLVTDEVSWPAPYVVQVATDNIPKFIQFLKDPPVHPFFSDELVFNAHDNAAAFVVPCAVRAIEPSLWRDANEK